jgi:predicted metal-dependent HD superfamily phosphohydrolase
MDRMLERFYKTLLALGAKGDFIEFYREAEERYNFPPDRSCHTFEGYIGFCLDELETVKNLFEEKTYFTVALALIFHNAICDFTLPKNEVLNAYFALSLCQKMGIENIGKKALSLILATDHSEIPAHTPYSPLTPINSQEASMYFMVDIDMAILGQNKDIFEQYERNTRKELRLFQDKLWILRHRKFISNLLAKPYIFHTLYFREKYENQAQLNLKNSLLKINP